jgi:signal transduction histidine kinase
MRMRSGYVLRGVLMLDAVLMAIVGFPLWGNYPGPLRRLGILMPDGYADLVPWHAISMAGLFGGALLAFAATLAALALSRDHERLLLASPLVVLGTCVLGFIAFAKVTAFDFPTAGYWMVIVLMAPAGMLFAAFAFELRGDHQSSPDARRLKEAAGQAERTRLARDLHDSVKQQLYSIHANLAAADARWETDEGGARVALAHARTGARDAMREMAALLDRLQSDPVEAVGLVEALRRQCDALRFQTGALVTTEFGPIPTADRIDAFAMNALFRIGQEALANVARHARPAHVSVSAGMVAGADTRDQFVLQVKDDGKGFDVAATREASSMGIRSMRERAREVGATLTIVSQPGRGTSIEAALRLRAPDTASPDAALRLMVGVGLPTLALLGWSTIWPVWRPFLQPILIIGAGVTVAAAVWAASAPWRKR